MKKRVKITLIIAAVWVAVVVLFLVLNLIFRLYSVDLTDYNDVGKGDLYTYITDNTERGGIIYAIDGKGKVQGMFQTAGSTMFSGWDAVQISVSNRDVYAVMGRIRLENKQEIHEYQIVAFNEELGAVMRTPPFKVMNTLSLSGFTAEDSSFYLTFISSNGSSAAVYSIPGSELVEIEKGLPSYNKEKEFSQKKVNVNEVLIETCPGGRFYAQAEYSEGILHTRLDNEVPSGQFLIDENDRALFRDRKMNLNQRIGATGMSFFLYIVFGIVGVVLIFLISYTLKLKRRVVYAVLAYEVVLVLLITFIFVFMVIRTRKISTENYERYEKYFISTLLEGVPANADLNFLSEYFYDTETYALLQNRIAAQIASSKGAVELKDICVVDQATGVIAFSGSGRNRQPIQELYGHESRDILDEINEKDHTKSIQTTLQGSDISIVAQSLSDQEAYGFVAVGISDYGHITDEFFANYGDALRYALILLLIGTGAGLVFFLLQAVDIRYLASALKKVAMGQEQVVKPPVVGTDMNYMWNSLFEIQKKINQTNRIKFLTYEAYYRFAPKSIERILKKDSITEVMSGDAIQLSGTMALLSTTGQQTNNPQELERLNHFMEIIEDSQRQEDGIFISSGSDLSFIKLLFLEETTNAGNFGIDLLEALREWQKREYPNACILMHYAPFVYGIAGTMEQSAAFLSSPETEALEGYLEWFRRMKLGLVVTSAVIAHEETKYDLRYIGFVTLNPEEPDKRLELYEVLDACSVRVRQIRLQTARRFAEALDLFYKQDFYFARNSFTDILRDMPDDEITKWYLFECERYLNEAGGTSFVGALHMDEAPTQ